MDNGPKTRDKAENEEPVRWPHVLAAAASVSVLWMTFVGTRAAHELEVGAAVAVLTVSFSAFVNRNCVVRGRFQLNDIFQAWRIPWYVLSDVASITLVLLKDLLHLAPAKSFFRVVSFLPGDDHAVALGRRVLATALTTATPSIVVVGIDMDRHRMLFHQIERSDIPLMTKHLGAHP